MGRIGYGELLLLLLVVLLLFGARKLPELARALGKSIGEFKKGKDEGATGEKDANSDCEKCDSKTCPDSKK